MSRSLISLVFACLGALQFVQGLSVPYRDISADSLKKIGIACYQEVNLDPAVIERVLKTNILSEDEKYKKFLVCSYKKQGYLSHDGNHFNYETLDGMLKYLKYTSDEIHELDHCKRIRTSEPTDLVYDNLKCILEGLKKVDRMRQRGEDEQLETNVIDTDDGVMVVD